MDVNSRRFTVFFQNRIFNQIDQATKVNEEVRAKMKLDGKLNPDNYDQMKSIASDQEEIQLFE